jgi:choline-sulfatase
MSDEHSFRCLSRCSDQRGEPVDTPTFDRLADQSANFDQTYCQMPLCTPSRLCMLTGREVRDCNAWDNRNVLPPDLTTLPEAFNDAGYDTSLVGKMHLGGNRKFGGFDDIPYGDLAERPGHQWEPLDRAGGAATGDRTADAGVTEIPESQLQEYVTTRESLSWIREQEAATDDPWFLCASFSRPHFPLTAPRRYLRRYWDVEDDEPRDRLTDPKVGYEGDTTDHPMTEGAVEGFEVEDIGSRQRQHARAAYFACVDFLDDIVGEFLAALERDGTLENTIIVYTSDHGELAGEHGLWWKHTWHEAATRVPWFVQTPDHRRGDGSGTTFETPTSLGDLFPTLCGLAGVETPSDLDGEDLSEAVETGVEPDRGPVFCDNLTQRWGEGTEFRAVREADYKYVGFRDAPELLFDLSEDPFEQENLAPDATGSDKEALVRLRETVAETMDFEAAAAERERDSWLEDEYELDVETASASENCYLMPDGTVVDADEPLYDPTVVTADPASTYDDYAE